MEPNLLMMENVTIVLLDITPKEHVINNVLKDSGQMDNKLNANP